jgi:hypothetical protein
MTFLLALCVVLSGINLLSRIERVEGLRGAYGKGIWAESSWAMIEAKEDRRNAIIYWVLFVAIYLFHIV